MESIIHEIKENPDKKNSETLDTAEVQGDSILLQWLHLINAETEDNLMTAEALAQKTNVPEIQDAIVRIRTLSADEKRK